MDSCCCRLSSSDDCVYQPAVKEVAKPRGKSCSRSLYSKLTRNQHTARHDVVHSLFAECFLHPYVVICIKIVPPDHLWLPCQCSTLHLYESISPFTPRSARSERSMAGDTAAQSFSLRQLRHRESPLHRTNEGVDELCASVGLTEMSFFLAYPRVVVEAESSCATVAIFHKKSV